MTEKTLGQQIGIIKVELSCVHKDGSQSNTNISIDFTGATNQQIKDWLVADRKVAIRPAIKKRTAKEVQNTLKDFIVKAEKPADVPPNPSEEEDKLIAQAKKLGISPSDIKTLLKKKSK